MTDFRERGSWIGLKKQVFSSIRNRWKCLFSFHDWFPMKFLIKCNITRVNQKKIKSLRKDMSCERALNLTNEKHFPITIGHRSLIMACLQIYLKLLSLATFFRVHSNSKEVSYLSLEKIRILTWILVVISVFLWTKLLENLLFEKYLISVAATLTASVPYHIETSQLICGANQLTGFYMMRTLAVNGLNELVEPQ